MKELVVKRLERKIENLLTSDVEIMILKKQKETLKAEINVCIDLLMKDLKLNDKEIKEILIEVTNKAIERNKEKFEEVGIAVSTDIHIDKINR